MSVRNVTDRLVAVNIDPQLLYCLVAIVILRRLVQLAKAFLPMLVTPLPMITLVRPVQRKASSPMVVTLSGMVMLTRLVQP
jgi:hypothetical protein